MALAPVGGPCVYRGGVGGRTGSNYPASSRYNSVAYSGANGIGFRSALW